MMIEQILNADKTVFFFFQRLQGHWFDYCLAAPAILGDSMIILTVSALLILTFDKKNSFEKVTLLTFGILAAYWAVYFMKFSFHRLRPHLVWENIVVLFDKPSNYAFPSGHTAIAFAAAFILNYIYSKKMRWTYAIAFWIGIICIYVGVHYLSDVIAGAVVGLVCGVSVCRLWELFIQTGTGEM